MTAKTAPATSAESGHHIINTEWWSDLMRGIYGPRKGGARIIIDAENAATGAGKTGLSVYLAELLSSVFEYDGLCVDDMTLSGDHYLQRWRDHPGAEQPSVIILDELAGAGAGHARRGMSSQNVKLGQAWQLMRKKRIVSIVTLPHWRKADKDLRQQADYRLWCREKPIGYFRPFKIKTGFDDGKVMTAGYDDVNRVKFPNLDVRGDVLFAALAEKKDDLLNSDSMDADIVEGDDQDPIDPDKVERQTKIKTAQRARDQGHTLVECAEIVDMSDSWVSNNTESPEED